MSATSASALAEVLALLAAWLVVGLAGLVRPGSLRFAGRTLFPLGALVSVAIAVVAAANLGAAPTRVVLPFGLPDLPMHLRLDPLSGIFLVLLGAASAGISVFAAGYFRSGEGTPPGLLCFQYHVFLASMGLVLLADDAYAFMIAWETMALSSYFLVIAQHRIAEIRRAGYLYLVMAHVGALAILLCFGVLQGGSWQFTFDAMRGAHLPPAWAGAAFLLALAGFGAKGGLVPLHAWLPEAHPAAPSPVSALLSGVMLKMAVYGLLRVAFDLIGGLPWWWGLVPVALGLFSALYGIAFAAAQTDMKRLLAYSSIENLGLLFTGIGLAMVFRGASMPTFAALALVAVLYHAINHAFMKSLLFLGTGAVLHSTGERNLGRLGGLIHRMPWVAWLTLVGALAIAGLPPLNGFVSEWLLLQAFLASHAVPYPFVNMLLPLGLGLVALIAALAGYVMVKFFGVVFLGRAREAALADAHDAGFAERLGLGWLALGCVLLGLLPAAVVPVLAGVAQWLGVGALPRPAAGWWMLVPLDARQASYAAPVIAATLFAAVAATSFVLRLVYRRRVRLAEPWACGGAGLSGRTQDTAEGFGQPIRHLFAPFFAMRRALPSPFDAEPRYEVTIGDRFWNVLYAPLAPLTDRVAGALAALQRGRIATFLLYALVTLCLLLALVLVL
ncbi:MAG: hydrogenase 4 subunit B [Gammaproteobacteria bacterium]|nr:hydrogenase 4 subunit B [Gammaproteobacteria bacterium]